MTPITAPTSKDTPNLHPNRITMPWGYVDFGNNEMEVVSTVPDPPKVRLVSPAGGGGAVSFDVLRPDGGQDEVAMILGQQDERVRGTTDTSGELRFYAQDGARPGDAGMYPILIIRHDGLFIRRADGNYAHVNVDGDR